MTDDIKPLGIQHAKITGQVMRDHWGPIVERIADEIADPRDAFINELISENERLKRSAEYWEQDAKRYAANQEHWRMEERTAIVAWLRRHKAGICPIRVIETLTTSKTQSVLIDAIEAGEHLK